MKLNNDITHDKDAVFLVFCRVMFRMDRLENEIELLEELPVNINRYKELQHKKVELAVLEEFFAGEECQKYIIEKNEEGDTLEEE